jgi:hypothetical protein
VKTKNFGAGGDTTSQSFLVRSLALTVGGLSLTLHNLVILPTKQHADIDALFGNMGEDLLQSATSFTLDFPHMRFVMESPLPALAHAGTGKG